MHERQLKRTERWFSLVYALKAGGRLSIADLKERFRVSERTIYRDLQALEMVGVPIFEEGGRYCIVDTISLRVDLTPTEIHLLTTALDFLQQRQAMGSASLGLREKLLATMPTSYKQRALRFSDSVVVDPQPATSQSDPVIEATLHIAVDEQKCVAIQHQSPGNDRPSERTVRPYGLVYRGPGLYLIAFCEMRQGIRFFRVNRIREARVLPQTFEKPKEFDLAAYVREHWGIEHGPLMQVKVRFSKDITSLVTETLWHPSQQVEPQSDGSVILSMAVRGKNEVARWLVGFGAQAEVLGPEELRQAVIELGQGIVDRYQSLTTTP